MIEGRGDRSENSTFDIGLCGFEGTSTDHAAIDYSPVVSTSGYRPIVKYAKPMVSGQEVLLSSFKGFNESAVFALLLLLILSVVNAHIVWAAERGENLHIHKEYGWGVFDSWWMSLVTALTGTFPDLELRVFCRVCIFNGVACWPESFDLIIQQLVWGETNVSTFAQWGTATKYP